MNLPAGTTSGRTSVEQSTVVYLHGHAPIYYPAPGGGQYCNGAICTHNHPDSNEGLEQARECGDRLARIIAQGRLPKWAVLDNPNL